MTDTGDMARRLHTEAAGWDPRGEHGETVGSITAAFARKLTKLNDRHARMSMPVLSLMDPNDVLADIGKLVGHLKFSAVRPLEPETVDALGAKCIALRLALARVEALSITSGDDDAA